MGENLHVLSIDSTIFFHTINFFLLFYVIKKYFFPRLVDIIEKRREEIAKNLSIADKAKEESKLIKEEMRYKILEHQREASEIIRQSFEKAKLIKNSIVEEAENIRREVLKNGETNLEIMRNKLEKDMKKDTIKIAIKIAEKILEENIQNKDKIEKQNFQNIDTIRKALEYKKGNIL